MIITEGDAVTRWKPNKLLLTGWIRQLDALLSSHVDQYCLGYATKFPRQQLHSFPGWGNYISFIACMLGWIGISRGSRPAGTVVQWRWSSLPGSSGGTRRSAALQAPCASRSAWARAGSPGTRQGRASCTRAPLGPAPPGSPYLSRGEVWNRLDMGQNVVQKVAFSPHQGCGSSVGGNNQKCCHVLFAERGLKYDI